MINLIPFVIMFGPLLLVLAWVFRRPIKWIIIGFSILAVVVVVFLELRRLKKAITFGSLRRGFNAFSKSKIVDV